MSDFRDYLNEQMKDPEFKREWDQSEPEFNAIQAIIDARKSMNMTQKELSERTGIDQSDISKIETGNGNPSLIHIKAIGRRYGYDIKA